MHPPLFWSLPFTVHLSPTGPVLGLIVSDHGARWLRGLPSRQWGSGNVWIIAGVSLAASPLGARLVKGMVLGEMPVSPPGTRTVLVRVRRRARTLWTMEGR